MTETTDRDALDDEIEAVLRANRILLERTANTGERLLTSMREYKEAVDRVLHEAGIELPRRGDRASRHRRR